MTIPRPYLHICQIWCKYPRPRYAPGTKFKIAAVNGSFLCPVPGLITRPPPLTYSAPTSTYQMSAKSHNPRLSICDFTISNVGRTVRHLRFDRKWILTIPLLTILHGLCVPILQLSVEFGADGLYRSAVEIAPNAKFHE